jgi:hypothetical protein
MREATVTAPERTEVDMALREIQKQGFHEVLHEEFLGGLDGTCVEPMLTEEEWGTRARLGESRWFYEHTGYLTGKEPLQEGPAFDRVPPAGSPSESEFWTNLRKRRTTHKPEPIYVESFRMFWQDRNGILLQLETYTGTRVNNLRCYFNWRPDPKRVPTLNPNDTSAYMNTGCEGVGDKKVFTGTSSHINSGMPYRLWLHFQQMEQYGTYVKPWMLRPYFWFLHYDEVNRKPLDSDGINAARLGRLPDYVREAISKAKNRY